MKNGRKLTYTPEIAKIICDRLADGENLKAISRDAGMPPESTVRGWATDDVNGFAALYARARQIQASVWADETIDMADRVIGADMATIQATRLAIDTRKWYASKIAAKVYGDRMQHDINGQLDLDKLSDDELNAKLSILLANHKGFVQA